MGVPVPLIVTLPTVLIIGKMDYQKISNVPWEVSVGLLMTYRCNLDCKYCYIHTKKAIDMSLDMAQKILEPYLQKEDGYVNIALMGGETLAAFDVLKPLVEWIENGKWPSRFRIFGNTNGTMLNDEMREWFKEHSSSITLGLSYDGLPESQENNRTILPVDLDFFIKTWPNQTIQMTINTETVNRMAEGVIYLIECGARVHPNVAYERNEWSDDDITEYRKQLDILADYYNLRPELPKISQFDHFIQTYADAIDNPQPQFQICGAGRRFHLYDVDGKSYPCHLLSPLVLSSERLSPISDGLVQKATSFADPKCKGCPFVSLCPTCIGCNYIYRGDLQKRDSTHCRVMREEVKAFIRKEVRRLSKVHPLSPEDAADIDAIVKLIRYFKSH